MVTSVVDAARADQLTFASTYQEKGIAFRGTVQKKGVKGPTPIRVLDKAESDWCFDLPDHRGE